jgi:hypothetical protein
VLAKLIVDYRYEQSVVFAFHGFKHIVIIW